MLSRAPYTSPPPSLINLSPHNTPARDLHRVPGQSILPSMKHGAHLQHCLRIRLMPGLTQSLSDPLQLYGGPIQVLGDTLKVALKVLVGLGEGHEGGLLASRNQSGQSVTMSSASFFIVMASLLIGSTAVSDSGYRCDCQCSSQYQGEDFHDALPVVIEKLQIPAPPDHPTQNAVLVDLFI